MEKVYLNKDWLIQDWMRSVAKHCIKEEFKKKDVETDFQALIQRTQTDTVH